MNNSKPRALHLPETAGPLHERLAAAIERYIADHRLQPGDRLPTHRELAQMSGVAIGTVTRALELLGGGGVVKAEVGRGTFVAEPAAQRMRDEVIELSINGPPQVIPEDMFRAASERAMRNCSLLPHGGYADQRGALGQRQVFADWLGRRGLGVAAESLFLTVGVQHGVHLAFKDLRRVSPLIATESSTYPGAIVAARELGMEMIPVRNDDEGMVPDHLDQVLAESGARGVYLTPVCHNPLGFEMGQARREALLAVIRRRDALIVEDDIYAIYGRKGGAPFYAMSPERTYYLNSVSKCLTPLLRVGVMAAPPEREADLLRSLRAEVWGAAPHAAEMACGLIELGAGDVVADALRSEARIRLQMAQQALRLDALPMPDGAPHIWLPMAPAAAERLALQARERGVRLTPPSASFVGGAWAGGVRLSIMATTTRADLQKALQIVAAARDFRDDMIV